MLETSNDSPKISQTLICTDCFSEFNKAHERPLRGEIKCPICRKGKLISHCEGTNLLYERRSHPRKKPSLFILWQSQTGSFSRDPIINISEGGATFLINGKDPIFSLGEEGEFFLETSQGIHILFKGEVIRLSKAKFPALQVTLSFTNPINLPEKLSTNPPSLKLNA